MTSQELKRVSCVILVVGILLRIAYVVYADIWIDETATLHHTLHWNLATMQLYNVNSGYYLLLQVLSGGNQAQLVWVAQILSLAGMPLAWWMLGRQMEEQGRDPFWARLFLVVWPPLFVFDCIMRPYSLGVGLLFAGWHLMNTGRLRERFRQTALGFVLMLGISTMYLNAVFFAVLALFSVRGRRKANLVLLTVLPLACFPATWYVLEQNLFHKPLIPSTGEPGSWWHAFIEPWCFFRYPRWLGAILGGILAVTSVGGMWMTSRWRPHLLATGLIAGLLWVTDTSSFDRLFLGTLVFILPSLEPGSLRVVGRSGPFVLLGLLLLSLPWVLHRSVKINGARKVAGILEERWLPGDRVAVVSGFQSLPLYWLAKEPQRLAITTLFHSVTTPEFYGMPPTATFHVAEDLARHSVGGSRVWVWGATPELDRAVESWPLEMSWQVESGGNGSRRLELRRKP